MEEFIYLYSVHLHRQQRFLCQSVSVAVKEVLCVKRSCRYRTYHTIPRDENQCSMWLNNDRQKAIDVTLPFATAKAVQIVRTLGIQWEAHDVKFWFSWAPNILFSSLELVQKEYSTGLSAVEGEDDFLIIWSGTWVNTSTSCESIRHETWVSQEMNVMF